MKIAPRSLRQKIFIGYLAGALLVMAFVLLSGSNLNNLEEMVKAGEVVSDLFDTTLEIRRFEKNYFLYETDDDYRELIAYVGKAGELINNAGLRLFASPSDIAELEHDIYVYRDLLNSKIRPLKGDERLNWEKALRAKGKDIVTIAERISLNRKYIKRKSLVDAKAHLLMGIALLIAVAIAAGMLFYMKAVKPLSVIEKHMDRISDGEFSLIDTQFDDSELISLKVAFNKMLMELQARQSHLVQSEKLASMGTLIFGVAHELNNPLSNIYTSAQILGEEIDGGNISYMKGLISQIEAETERAKDVVGSVLDYSRTKEKTKFNLRRAVEETIRFMKAEIPSGISVLTKIPEKIMLFADKQKIQQVFINLISNALDAMGEEGEISVSSSQEDGKVEIVVQDNGSGMDQDTLSKIFDPFYTSKKSRKGYGLGLFIVHNIIEEHGGNISVGSRPDIGTVFAISLPEGMDQNG